MTVIQSWLEAIQAALGPRITWGHPRIVIMLSPHPLSVSSFVFEFAFEFVSVFLLVFVFLISCVVREDICRKNCDVMTLVLVTINAILCQ